MEDFNMTLAPIVLFTYSRPWHTRQTIESLTLNEYASESELIVYSDGYKDEKSRKGVEDTRQYIKFVSGFKSVRLIERDRNWGLANNIIDGVTTVVNEYGRIIVLEDDLLTSPYFLKFMNEGLQKYERCDTVVSIHGYLYPIKGTIPENFLLCHTDSLGWGTWKDAWNIFNPDGRFLWKNLKEKGLETSFNFNTSYNFIRMLSQQIEGKNNSWAIRWYASTFLTGKLSLYPNKSLVYHNGNDELGTNSSYGDDDWLNVELSEKPISLIDIPIKENIVVRNTYEKFFRRNQSGFYNRIKRKIKSICGKIKKNHQQFF